MAIEAPTTRVFCGPHGFPCSLPDGLGFFEAHWGSALPGTPFFALGMAVALGIRPAGWQQTHGSGDLARRLRLHTPEPRTKNQTLVQWSDSADTMAAPFSEATEAIRTGASQRQHGMRQDRHWKIFFEGVIG